MRKSEGGKKEVGRRRKRGRNGEELKSEVGMRNAAHRDLRLRPGGKWEIKDYRKMYLLTYIQNVYMICS